MPLFFVLLGFFIFLVKVYIKLNWKETWEGESRSNRGKVWLITYSCFSGFFLSLVATIIIGGILGLFPERQKVPDKIEYIAAINDGSSINGNFFIGIGAIKEESYYFYYKKLDCGGYVQEKIKTEGAIIFESDSEIPHIQYNEYEFVNKNWNDWAFPSQFCNPVYIYVPKGSIKQNYVFDLE